METEHVSVEGTTDERKPAHEAISQPAAALAGTQIPLPIPAPPFDFNQALKLIAERNRDVQRAREHYEELREETSQARKELDKESELLEKLIADLDTRRSDAEDAAARPRLPLEACPYERQTGQPCPICQRANREPLTAAELASLVSRFQIVIKPSDIESWSPGQRDVMTAAAHEALAAGHGGIAWPRQIGQPHVAGEPAEDGRQHCVICGGQIGDTNDIAYETSWLVGTDCPGAPDAKPAA